ncbi:MAG: oxygenase MpaB family protein, partial [Gammaproteobacteria bacterium]
MDVAAEGLFRKRSVFWRVNRESVLLVGGGAALLLQVAHPLVAAGVADHSDFRERPLRRLYRTVRAMQTIICGDRESALATVERINTIHQRVQGTLEEPTSLYPAGTHYRADDPELVLWVYATLTATTVATYNVFLPRLSEAEERELYLESKTIARLFGVPEALIPATLDDFRRYWDTMLAGPVLEITPSSRALANDILHPPITGFPNVVGDLIGIAALALLPPVLRERYGFKWDRKRVVLWNWAQRVLRGTLPLVPDM